MLRAFFIATLSLSFIAPLSAFAQTPSEETEATEVSLARKAYGAYQRGFYLSAARYAADAASEEDSSSSMTLLGLLYARGLGVPQNFSTAADWYRLAAQRGDREAQLALGVLYANGRGVERSIERAFEWFEKSAEQDQPTALYNLALIYLEGAAGQERQPELAAALLNRAARLEHIEAQYGLGVLYRRGIGVVQNPVQAAEWIGRAAKEGLPAAQVEYGIMVFNGEGMTKSEEVAAQWFELAAEAGDPDARNRLARLYATGRGVQLNPIEAAKWHFLAEASGVNDVWLENFVGTLSDADREMARRRAAPYNPYILVQDASPQTPATDEAADTADEGLEPVVTQQ